MEVRLRTKVFSIIVLLQVSIIIFFLVGDSGQEVLTYEEHYDRNYELEYLMESNSSTEKNGSIIALGDSFTAGYNLENREKAWPSVLESELESNENDFQVRNFGMPGTGLEEHIDRYKENEHSMEAEILILAIASYDIANYSRVDEIFIELLEDSELDSKLNDIEDPSDTNYEQMSATEERKLVELRETAWLRYVHELHSKSDEKLQTRLLSRLERLDKNLDSETSVLILMLGDFHDFGFSSVLETYSKDNDWDYVEWAEFYKGRAERQEVVISEYDNHYNEYGNLIWGEELYKVLREHEMAQ